MDIILIVKKKEIIKVEIILERWFYWVFIKF